MVTAVAQRHLAATSQAHPTTSHAQGHRKSLGGSEAELPAKPMKYCCVYLPDGTASLASVRPGHSIRDMLVGICEKRGFSLPDIKVYLVGNEQVGRAGGEGAPASQTVPGWDHMPFCLLPPDGSCRKRWCWTRSAPCWQIRR